jgi:transporter family protein
MEWLAATVGAAIIWSFTGIIAKELMDHSSSLVYSFLYSSLALIFYTPVFIYFLPQASFELSTWLIIALVVSGIANVFGIMSYNYSIKFGELSRVIPFTKLNPVFTAIIAALVLGEQMTQTRVFGIILVTIGSYAILEEKNSGWKKPFTNFVKLKAPKYAALSALVYSFASVADRFGTQIIQPEIYTFIIYVIITSTLSVYLLTQKRELIPDIKTNFNQHRFYYIITGIGAALASYLIFFAFSQAQASRVIPVLQIQVFISVAAGYILFNEDHLREKIIGSLILVAGVILVAL